MLVLSRMFQYNVQQSSLFRVGFVPFLVLILK